jgi:hypothetical protein
MTGPHGNGEPAGNGTNSVGEARARPQAARPDGANLRFARMSPSVHKRDGYADTMGSVATPERGC